ncbi:hypothetical protein [Nocardioides ultimimeridianus]
MVIVTIDYVVYTWARRVLDGQPNGFGIVERSTNWPPDLDLPDFVLTLTDEERRHVGHTYGGTVAVPAGRLLVIKRVLGADGSGRPGNYIAVVALDRTSTLGPLDLIGLLNAGAFTLDKRIDGTPRDGAEAVEIKLPDSWPPPASNAPPAVPVAFETLDEAASELPRATLVLPPDMLNRQPLWTGAAPARVPIRSSFSKHDEALIERARAGGWSSTAQWWRRADGVDWIRLARDYLDLIDPQSTRPIMDLLRAAEPYSEEHVAHALVSQLVTRFPEYAGNERVVASVTSLVVPFAAAESPELAIDLVRTAARANLGESTLAEMIGIATSEGVPMGTLLAEDSEAADRVRAVLGLSRPPAAQRLDQQASKPAALAPSPSRPAPATSVGTPIQAFDERFEAILDDVRDRATVSRLREAADRGASPEEIWARIGGAQLDGLFISAFPGHAGFWADTIAADPLVSDRELGARLRRNRKVLARATMPALLGEDYLALATENRVLRRLVLGAGLLLLVTLAFALVALRY